MNPRPTGLELEEVKRRSRARHRDRIQSAYEKAKLCREQYDEQRVRGEIGDELYNDMIDAAYRLYSQLRPAVLDTDFEERVSDAGDVIKQIYRSENAPREVEDVSPKVFAAVLDSLTATAVKTGLAEKEDT